ncbi:hypothetical protein ACFX2A_034681 [Malus domestica]
MEELKSVRSNFTQAEMAKKQHSSVMGLQGSEGFEVSGRFGLRSTQRFEEHGHGGAPQFQYSKDILLRAVLVSLRRHQIE